MGRVARRSPGNGEAHGAERPRRHFAHRFPRLQRRRQPGRGLLGRLLRKIRGLATGLFVPRTHRIRAPQPLQQAGRSRVGSGARGSARSQQAHGALGRQTGAAEPRSLDQDDQEAPRAARERGLHAQQANRHEESARQQCPQQQRARRELPLPHHEKESRRLTARGQRERRLSR